MKTFEVIYHQQPRKADPITESHRYTEEWEITEWHCPKCAAKAVWENQGGGDYYIGTQLICVGCGFSWHMPSAGPIEDHGLMTESDVQRLAALRSKS